MPETSILSVRLDTETKERLDELARSTRRSKSFLAAQAIEAFIEEEAWQIAEIEKAIVEADAGNFATPAEVKAVFGKRVK